MVDEREIFHPGSTIVPPSLLTELRRDTRDKGPEVNSVGSDDVTNHASEPLLSFLYFKEILNDFGDARFGSSECRISSVPVLLAARFPLYAVRYPP